jgi:hypothetical protein
MKKRLGGPQSWSGCSGKEKNISMPRNKNPENDDYIK